MSVLEAPVDIHDPVTALCESLGYEPSYVYRIDLTPTEVTVHAYRGKDGFCKGAKFVVDGEPAYEEPRTLKVST